MTNSKFAVGQQVVVVGNDKDDFYSMLAGEPLYAHAVPNGQIVTIIEVDEDDGQLKVDTKGIELMSEHARPEFQWLEEEYVEAVAIVQG